MNTALLTHCDILEWAANFEGPPFHAALFDAPYELREVSQEELEAILQGQIYRAGEKGFMGREWDGSGIAFWADTWRAVARHLLPGAFLFIFGGTLNDDLISVSMRLAGLRKHHKMLSWAYGSGLQKSTRMDDKLDRRAGAERRVISTRKHAPKFAAAEFGYREKDNGYNSRTRETFEETAPATDMAQTWAGHRYGLQHLKPAVEPILVFQKPYDGDALNSITRTGAGAVNIDGGRIGTEETWRAQGPNVGVPSEWGRLNNPGQSAAHDLGRWPANLALSHHPACNGTCHEDCAVARLGAQSGERASGVPTLGVAPSTKNTFGEFAQRSTVGHTDTGTAARYFFNADWLYERLEAADQIGYFAKTSRAEREAGLDPLQVALMAELAGEAFDETTVDDGRKTPIDNPFLRGETTRRNTHTTLKPIALTRWLATLLLPPAAYGPRRLLVPFAGAASEMIGAVLAGWEEVQGVELVEEHVRIGRARLAYWKQRAGEFLAGQDITVKQAPAAPKGQMTIFDVESAA